MVQQAPNHGSARFCLSAGDRLPTNQELADHRLMNRMEWRKGMESPSQPPIRLMTPTALQPRWGSWQPAAQRVFLCSPWRKREGTSAMENVWFQSALWMALALLAAMGSLCHHDLGCPIRDCRWRYRRQHSGAAADAMDQLHRWLRRDCPDISRGHGHRPSRRKEKLRRQA